MQVVIGWPSNIMMRVRFGQTKRRVRIELSFCAEQSI